MRPDFLALIAEASIQPFTIKSDVSCRWFIGAFHQVEEGVFYFSFVECLFLIVKILDFMNILLYPLGCHVFFFFFLSFIALVS